jgi:nucleotide-binding universal stress UspA family protein
MARCGRVVVGVDASPAGLQALRWAVAEARRRGTELYAVRVWRFSSTAWQCGDVAQWRDEIECGAVGEVRAAFLEALGGVPADVRVMAVAAEGCVPEVLMAYAHHDDDLLVVGASTRRRFRGAGVGRGCVRSASCPVVVVPPPALARSGTTRALARQLSRETEEFVNASTRRGGRLV